jgi:hypothetical protein
MISSRAVVMSTFDAGQSAPVAVELIAALEGEEQNMPARKILVVYYSWWGTTRKIAKALPDSDASEVIYMFMTPKLVT